MEKLKNHIADLPTITVGGEDYLSYQAVTDTVAAFLFPAHPTDQIDEAGYQHILETADTLCQALGYADVVKLTPPDVPLNQMGLYWQRGTPDQAAEEIAIILAGPGLAEELADGRLVDVHMSRLGLDEVTRQHFKIPVTATDGLLNLMDQAVNSHWPNDYKGIWHDVLGLCIAAGRDISPRERLFTVIIRGLGRKRYWQLKAAIHHDAAGDPYMVIGLAEEPGTDSLFELGQVVMTMGVEAMEIDVMPFLTRHHRGDWGEMDAGDWQRNDRAVKEGTRIFSAYSVVTDDGMTERIWIITEADRSVTTILRPDEY
jgi:hypothetical protein